MPVDGLPRCASNSCAMLLLIFRLTPRGLCLSWAVVLRLLPVFKRSLENGRPGTPHLHVQRFHRLSYSYQHIAAPPSLHFSRPPVGQSNTFLAFGHQCCPL